MSGSTKNWRVLLVRAALGSVIVGVIVTPQLAEWAGFGEDKTTSEEERVDGSKQRVVGDDKRTLTKISTQTKTGGKGLWDVLELTGTLAVPFLLVYLSTWFQRKEQERAATHLRDEALQAYLNSMSDLLLNHNLGSSDNNSPVRGVARARTLTVLRRLGNDGERKGSVIQFLVDANLVSGSKGLQGGMATLKYHLSNPGVPDMPRRYRILNLTNPSSGITLDLSDANLTRTHLSSAILINAILNNADLSGANLHYANLHYAHLEGADLSGANLGNAYLVWTYLNDADLSGANLGNAYLQGANLQGANLQGADLSGAHFESAISLTTEQVQAAKNW